MSLVVVLLWFWAAFANSLYARHLEFYFDCGVFYVVRRFQCDASFVGCRFCVYFPHFFGAWLCAGWYSAHICALLCSSIVFFPTSHFIKYISNLMRGVNRKSFHVKPVVSAFFALISVPHVICCSTFCYSSKLFLSRSFLCSSFHGHRFVFCSFIDRLVITWILDCSSTILQLCRQFIFISGLISHGMEQLLVCCYFCLFWFALISFSLFFDNDLFFCSTLLFLHSMFYVFIYKVFGLPNLLSFAILQNRDFSHFDFNHGHNLMFRAKWNFI